MSPRPNAPLALLVVWLGSSCGMSSAEVDGEEFEDLGISEGSARVTPQQAAQANLIVDSTRSYLPYAYKADGCYARALYMSMELAGRRIPTSAQYLSGYLQPTPAVAWGWHVAPMVEIDGTGGQRTILDPSLAPTGPVPLNEWVRRSNPIGSYTLEWTLGSVYYTSSYSQRNAEANPVIQSFSELTPFQKSDIEHACAVMHNYLEYEGTAETSAKQKLLLGRTRTLANRLLSVGKLDGFAVGGPIGCGGRSVPLCRDPGASCARNEDCCSLLCAGVCKTRPVDLVVDAGLPAVPDAGSPVDAGPTSFLQNGVTVSGLSGAARSTRAFRFEVPAGASAIRFELHGGAGDADLYVRFGAPPTATAYDYRPYRSDSEETVVPSPVRSGTWFVMVTGYTSFSGLTLTATHDAPGGATADAGVKADAGTGGGSTPELVNGVAVTGMSGAAGTTRLFRFEVPAGASAVRFEMHGASGDADLYVRFGAAPTAASYDYRPYLPDAEETVTPSPVRSGTWFVMVDGYSSYSGVSLQASYLP